MKSLGSDHGLLGIESPASAGCQCSQTCLLDAGYVTSLREGWVRVSPHFYITEDEVDGLVRTAAPR